MFTKFLSFGARQLRPPQLSWWIVHIISFLKKINAANRQEILAVPEWGTLLIRQLKNSKSVLILKDKQETNDKKS